MCARRHELRHGSNAGLAALACHIDVVGARFLKSQAHKLASALDGGPVVQLIPHRYSCCSVNAGPQR